MLCRASLGRAKGNSLFHAETYNTAWDAAFQPSPSRWFVFLIYRSTIVRSTIVRSRKEPSVIDVSLPGDFQTNLLMFFRWFHFLAGITWIGLLYFFNLVNFPLMKELDPATKSKVFPALMTRALWWFRWASVVTVLMGLAYWGSIVGSDARNGGASSGVPMGSFFGIWTVTWAVMYACVIPGKGALDKGPVLAVIYAIVVTLAAWTFLHFN